jgi:manganese-dependent inorganic pyrophosphatase
MACAWHLSCELHEPVLAARAGPLNQQAAWLLDRLGLQAPVLLTDVAPQVGWVSRQLFVVHPSQSLLQAWDVLHECTMAFQPGSPIADSDPEDFGRALLRVGGGLAARAPRDVVCSDLKEYSAAGMKFGAGQVEVADEPDLDSHIVPLREALASVCREMHYDFGVLMITEVVAAGSRIVIHAPPPALSELPYRRLLDDTFEAPGVVSRKKQLLPAILSLLER